MTVIKIIAFVLMIVPIAMMAQGMKRHKRERTLAGLKMIGAGVVILFVPVWIATGRFLFAVLIVLAMIIFHATKLARTKEFVWARPVAMIASAVAIAAAAISLSLQLSTGDPQKLHEDYISRRARVNTLKMEYIGGMLADRLNGRKALLILNSPLLSNDREATMSGLKKGIAGRVSIVEVIHAEKVFDQASNYIYMPGEYDALLAAHNDYDVVISFIPLPIKPEQMKHWERGGGKPAKFVLIEVDGVDLRQYIEKRWCEAAIVNRPEFAVKYNQLLNLKLDAPTSKAVKTVLDTGLVYVDDDNLDSLQ